jgi:molecular chaperone GrpE
MSERAADERPPTEAAAEGAPAEAAAEGAPAEEASERVEEDLDELTKTQRERDEYLELAQRTRADFENYRKRVAAEAQAATARGKAELARELIPVVDSLERAIDGMEGADENLVRGVVLVLDELSATLGRAGVESYDPSGEQFDPNLHEAVSTQEAEGTDSGTVIETLDRGYRLDGKVLRPARVVVSK